MPFVEWKDEFSVGIQKLDEQHKKLVEYLNRLYSDLEGGKGKDAVGEVLGGMIRYTKEHFITEETLMKRHGYPDYESHAEKHRKMAERVLELKIQYGNGEIEDPTAITRFLKDWLAKHIMGTDRKYGPFLNAKGVK